jgi:hypothetical protein
VVRDLALVAQHLQTSGKGPVAAKALLTLAASFAPQLTAMRSAPKKGWGAKR